MVLSISTQCLGDPVWDIMDTIGFNFQPFLFDQFVNMIEEMNSNIPLVGINSVGSGGEPLKMCFHELLKTFQVATTLHDL